MASYSYRTPWIPVSCSKTLGRGRYAHDDLVLFSTNEGK
jgi:hypothetical protein